jgi:hemolysin activation/secretion protein
MNSRQGLQTLALSLALSGCILSAWGEEAPVMPFTASELPVMATTPNLVYGSYGPQVILDAPTFKNLPEPIYLEKALEQRFGLERTVDISGISVIYQAPLKQESERTQGAQNLSLDQTRKLAAQYLLKCQDSGYLCDAAVSLKDDNALNIVLTPLTVESIQVESEDLWQKKALTSQLRWIRPNQPFKLHAAQQQLRLIQSNPDFPLASELEVIPYSHQLTVKISATSPKSQNHLIGTWNNLDQPIFGRQFGALTAISNNLTGHGDSLMVSGVQGYRSTGVFSHYELPVTPAFRPFAEYSIARISPFQELYTNGDTHGRAYRVTAGLKYVLYDRPNRRLSADVAFDFKEALSRAKGGRVPLEREAVRTIRGGLNYDQKWKSASLSMRHELAAGLPIFSGSLSDDPRLSWYKGGSQYFRYTGYALLTKQLPMGSVATLNTQWQLTPDGLSNFDVGGLGGTFYGRGYREVYLFVDNYSITSLQWQVPARFLPKRLKMPFSDKPLKETTSLLTFVDYGYGVISAAPKGVDRNDHILSTGVGIRSQVTNRLSGRLDIGFPILREPPFSQKPRLHFGLDLALF